MDSAKKLVAAMMPNEHYVPALSPATGIAHSTDIKQPSLYRTVRWFSEAKTFGDHLFLCLLIASVVGIALIIFADAIGLFIKNSSRVTLKMALSDKEIPKAVDLFVNRMVHARGFQEQVNAFIKNILSTQKEPIKMSVGIILRSNHISDGMEILLKNLLRSKKLKEAFTSFIGSSENKAAVDAIVTSQKDVAIRLMTEFLKDPTLNGAIKELLSKGVSKGVVGGVTSLSAVAVAAPFAGMDSLASFITPFTVTTPLTMSSVEKAFPKQKTGKRPLKERALIRLLLHSEKPSPAPTETPRLTEPRAKAEKAENIKPSVAKFIIGKIIDRSSMSPIETLAEKTGYVILFILSILCLVTPVEGLIWLFKGSVSIIRNDPELQKLTALVKKNLEGCVQDNLQKHFLHMLKIAIAQKDTQKILTQLQNELKEIALAALAGNMGDIMNKPSFQKDLNGFISVVKKSAEELSPSPEALKAFMEAITTNQALKDHSKQVTGDLLSHLMSALTEEAKQELLYTPAKKMGSRAAKIGRGFLSAGKSLFSKISSVVVSALVPTSSRFTDF